MKKMKHYLRNVEFKAELGAVVVVEDWAEWVFLQRLADLPRHHTDLSREARLALVLLVLPSCGVDVCASEACSLKQNINRSILMHRFTQVELNYHGLIFSTIKLMKLGSNKPRKLHEADELSSCTERGVILGLLHEQSHGSEVATLKFWIILGHRFIQVQINCQNWKQ